MLGCGQNYQNNFLLNKTFLGLFTVTVSQRAVPRQKSLFPDNHPFDSPLVRLFSQSPGGYLADHPLLWTRRQGCLGQAHLSLRRRWELWKSLGTVLLLWGWCCHLDSHPESALPVFSETVGRHLCSCNKARRRSEKALHIAQLGLFQCTRACCPRKLICSPWFPLFHMEVSQYTLANQMNEWLERTAFKIRLLHFVKTLSIPVPEMQTVESCHGVTKTRAWGWPFNYLDVVIPSCWCLSWPWKPLVTPLNPFFWV